MPQCQFPVFCYFFVLGKLHRKYSQNWMIQKLNLLIFTEASRRPKRRWRGARGQPHHQGAPWPRPPMMRAPWSTPDDAPSPIKSSRREKPKPMINFLETHRDPPPSPTRYREGLESLLGTLSERGISTGGLLHCHACLWRIEWVVNLGLWVNSSS
jgi:hypothetical protein